MSTVEKVPVPVDRLKNALVWAWFDVSQYKMLYTSGQERIELLTETAGLFFERLNHFYWDRFTLSISRMTDPRKTGKNRNLSIHSLEDHLDLLPENRRPFVLQTLVSIDGLARKYRVHRSKHVAHDDYRDAISESKKSETLRLTEIESILRDVGSCLNEFYGWIEKTTWSWEMLGPNNANSLIYYLREGAIYTELKQKRKDWTKDAQEESESRYKDLYDSPMIDRKTGSP
jgi:hypothetical protein